VTENHVKIQGGPSAYVIEIDGHPMQNITEAVSLELSGSRLPSVLLKLATYSVDIDATALVELDPDAEVALKALGWTPPEDKEGPA
jgi:hypothetical protein